MESRNWRSALCACEQEFGNLHDPYAVSVVCKDNVIVGHVPRTISALCYFFLRNGTILCQVTGTETTPFCRFAARRDGGALHFDRHLLFEPFPRLYNSGTALASWNRLVWHRINPSLRCSLKKWQLMAYTFR